MADYLGLCLNLKGGQLSQWANYNFNSIAKIGNHYVGAGEDGLMQLETGDLDNTADIDAFFELVTSDWGIPAQKRIRSMYVGYETNGDLTLTVSARDSRSPMMSPASLVSSLHTTNQSPLDRGIKSGCFWSPGPPTISFGADRARPFESMRCAYKS